MKIYESEQYMPFDFSKSLKTVQTKKLENSGSSFISLLIEEEILWLKRFLCCVEEHLSERTSQGVRLVQHENIRALIADVVLNIEILNLHRHSLDTPMHGILSKLIMNSCSNLAKLAGGRAFLTGNIIEMLWTFEIINLIYMGS